MVSFLNNLHPLLKRKKDKNIQDDPSFALIDTIERELIALESEAIKSKGQSFLASASGEYLDNFGSWFNVARKPNEVDTNYRQRILANVTRRKGTIPGIEDAITTALGIPGLKVKVTEPLKNIFFLSSSKLNSKDRLMGEYYRFGTLELNLYVDFSVSGTNLLGDGREEYTNNPSGKMVELVKIGNKNLSEVFDLGGSGTYTMSFDLKSADTTNFSNIAVYPYPATNPINEYKFPYTNFNVTTEYKRYSLTFDVEHSNPELSKTIMVFYGKYDTGNIPFIKNIKIEKGSKATPFTSSPLDYMQGYDEDNIKNVLKSVISEYKPTGTEVYYKGVKI